MHMYTHRQEERDTPGGERERERREEGEREREREGREGGRGRESRKVGYAI
jgi:hypothetical protein